jgi:phage shock protein A
MTERENLEAAIDMLESSILKLRRMIKMMDAGKANPEKSQRMMRKTIRVSKRTTALLKQIAAEFDGEEAEAPVSATPVPVGRG